MPTKQTVIESVAKVLIIDNENRVLTLVLGEHLKYPEKSYRPDLPGGIVDPGESELSAVIREVKEECGFALDPEKVQPAYSETAYYEKENKSVTKLLYIAYVDERRVVKLSWEHSDYRWVTLEDLQAINLQPFFNNSIKYSIQHKLIRIR
ncbi:MAG: NUDIX domain-containing protein [Candidatus Saccharimonadales bacterium]